LRTICCDVVNRGVALYGTNAYMATLDNHVVALDARTGEVQWNKQIYPLPGRGYAMTLAPLAVEGKIIVGESGGEFGIRGFIVALDAATGAEKWRRYTIPVPANQITARIPARCTSMAEAARGSPARTTSRRARCCGASVIPSPWLAKLRPGRNLYSDSVIALDIDSGRVKWYFQQTPNDSWDYDATNSPVLADVTIAGKPRKVFYQAARNGWFYVVDRTTAR
jgi:alcohol dehydrogenase (cytochrome c)